MSILLGALEKPTNVLYRLGKPYKDGDFYVQEVVVKVRNNNYKQYDYSNKKETLIKRYKKFPLISKSMFKYIS